MANNNSTKEPKQAAEKRRKLASGKRIRENLRRREINKSCSSKIKTYQKKFIKLMETSTPEEIQSAFVFVQSRVMKASKKGILKPNTASRKISKIAKIKDKKLVLLQENV
jgi:small subunit ribosomal protein S20